MTLVAYPALLTSRGSGEASATFVDLPDITVFGSEPAELIRLARERLSRTLKAMEKDGHEWPAPSSLTDVLKDHQDAIRSLIWVDVTVDDRPVRVHILLGEHLLASIDAQANARSLSRSGFLAMAAKRQLGSSTPMGGDAGQRLLNELTASGQRIQRTFGPDTPVSRTLAELDAIASDGLHRMTEGLSSALAGWRERPLQRPETETYHAEG